MRWVVLTLALLFSPPVFAGEVFNEAEMNRAADRAENNIEDFWPASTDLPRTDRERTLEWAWVLCRDFAEYSTAGGYQDPLSALSLLWENEDLMQMCPEVREELLAAREQRWQRKRELEEQRKQEKASEAAIVIRRALQ